MKLYKVVYPNALPAYVVMPPCDNYGGIDYSVVVGTEEFGLPDGVEYIASEHGMPVFRVEDEPSLIPAENLWTNREGEVFLAGVYGVYYFKRIKEKE